MEFYNKMMKSKKMTVDEAIDVVDRMYQDRMKQIEEDDTIHVGELDNVEFTILEFAGVRLLREVQSLKRELQNSIPKKRIEEDLKTCQKVYEKEMKPYQTEYGLDVTGLSKKEKEELSNKRNCLIVQMETYKQLLKKNQ